MKMTWKTLLAAGCALSMLFTMPGSAVLAEELQEDAVIVSEAAQIDSEEADLDTDISADIDENAPDSGTYDAIELPADAVEVDGDRVVREVRRGQRDLSRQFRAHRPVGVAASAGDVHTGR